MENCPLCGREMIRDGKTVDEHHLVPKSMGGRETVSLHRICHQKVHSVLTERELAKDWFTVEKLKQHPEIQKFIKWVKKKDPQFIDVNRDTNDRRRKRKK
jgi:hypothetical protein